MRILLTNDDGIHAPGIRALFEALTGLGEIVCIAPLTVQSASGHGVTFGEPLMREDVVISDTMRGVAVDGRPADCVKVALRAIWQERYGPGTRPDLTISGTNMGANVGINIIYSGTVAAAVESAFLGVPAIAVSLHLVDRARVHYGRADLRGRYISGPGVRQALEGDTEADLVVIAERGRLRVLRVGPRLSPRPHRCAREPAAVATIE